MKKLLIYTKNSSDKNVLSRAITVTADFVGIGQRGQINEQEFKKLAYDLEPKTSFIQVINA